MYVYMYANTAKHCNLLHDRPVLSTGRTLHDKIETVLTKTKIWSCVPDGLNSKTDSPSVVK